MPPEQLTIAVVALLLGFSAGYLVRLLFDWLQSSHK